MPLFKTNGFRMTGFKSLVLCASLFGSLLGFAHGVAFADTNPAAAAANAKGPEQRVALVIGNSNYQSAPVLANPDDDANSMAKLLNEAGFEVVSATDLTRADMVKVMQDFSNRVAARGPNTVAMVYYAGHGIQVAGENYLIPVDAKITAPADLASQTVRLVDMMGTLETIPSRMRIVVLDACRNNPFPQINDAGRGLAIVDAPTGSIVGYSTAPGSEAQDGSNGHSPYTQAFLKVAREPNLPIEQLFKRVRLEVNNTTDGQQIPWESSSLTSDFYFFGDTAVAATRAPDRSPVVQTASNLPSRSARQAYDYVLSEGSPQRYQEFIQLFPSDPLADRIRGLLRNLLQADAWHKTVLANSPAAYKSFYDSNANSPYAQSALQLQSQPKIIPLMQFTRLVRPQPQFGGPAFRPTNIGINNGPINAPNNGPGNVNNGPQFPGKLGGIFNNGKPQNGDLNGKPTGPIATLPPGVGPRPPVGPVPAQNNNQGNNVPANVPTPNNGGGGKIVTLPPQGNNPANNVPTTNGPANNGGAGKIVTLPPRGNVPGNNSPVNTQTPNNGGAGKVVTLPPTNGGRPPLGPVAKPNDQPSRIFRRDGGVFKPNNPPQVGGAPNNNPRIGGGNAVKLGGNNNNPSRFAMGQNNRRFH